MQKEHVEAALKYAMDTVLQKPRQDVGGFRRAASDARDEKNESYKFISQGIDKVKEVERAADAKIQQANDSMRPITEAISSTESFVNKRLKDKLIATTDPERHLNFLDETNPGTNSGSHLAKQYIREIKDAYIEKLSELDPEFAEAVSRGK